jgi:hypothetical protein
LCYRLSGLGAHTSLAKLAHSRSKEIHPVLFSYPFSLKLKNRVVHTLDQINFYKFDEEIEDNLDEYFFTWKVLETYLIQPTDEKGDNLVIKLLENNKYALVSIDNDNIFGFEDKSIEHPNLYSIVYLLNTMRKDISYLAIKAFLDLDHSELLISWLNSLMLQFKYLVGEGDQFLFSNMEVEKIVNFKKTFSNYITSNINQCFNFKELPALFDRFVKLFETIEILTKKIKEDFFKNLNMANIIKYSDSLENSLDHFKLLQGLDERNHNIYLKAFKEKDIAINRFKQLPFINQHFERRKIQNIETVGSTIPNTSTLFDVFKSRQSLFPIVKYDKLKIQIEYLKDHINKKNFKTTNYPKYFQDYKVINNSTEYRNNLSVLSLENCDELTNDALIDLIKYSESLSYLYINKCKNLNGEFDIQYKKKGPVVRFNFLDIFYVEKQLYYTTMKKDIKVFIFSGIDFQKINLGTNDLNIEHLYIINLPKLSELSLSIYEASYESITLQALNNLEDVDLRYVKIKNFKLIHFKYLRNLTIGSKSEEETGAYLENDLSISDGMYEKLTLQELPNLIKIIIGKSIKINRLELISLTNCRYLTLNSSIKTIKLEDVPNLEKLKSKSYLELSLLKSLKKLQELKIGGCVYETFTLQDLLDLKEVRFEEDIRIKNLNLNSLMSLKELDIECKIDTIKLEDIPNLEKLKSKSCLELSLLKSLKKLQELSIGGVYDSFINQDLLNLKVQTFRNVSFDCVGRIILQDVSFINTFTKLRFLKIGGCVYETFTLQDITLLEELSFESAHIKHLNIENLKNLKTVSNTYCSYETIILKDLPNLEKVYFLGFCKVANLFLHQLKKFQELRRDTPIKKISYFDLPNFKENGVDYADVTW